MNKNSENKNMNTNDSALAEWALEQAQRQHLRALRDSGSISEQDYIDRAHMDAGGV